MLVGVVASMHFRLILMGFFSIFPPKVARYHLLNGESVCNKLKRGHVYFKAVNSFRNGGEDECVSYWY